MKKYNISKGIAALFIGLILLGQHAWGQNFRQDMQSMKVAFTKMNKLHAEVEVKVYENASSSKVIETKRSTIRKDGDNYHYNLDNLSLLMNEKCMLLVHHDEKQIVYSKRDVKEEKSFGIGTLSPEIDSVLNRHDSVVYKGSSNQVKHYIVYSSGSNTIKKTEVFLDAKTLMIKKLVYYYNTELFSKAGKVVVEYKTFNTAPVFGPGEFSEKKYVEPGKDLKPSKSYSAYSVFNYDPNQF